MLLVLFLFSFLALQLLTSYQETIDFNHQSQKLYQGKTAKELFLIDYPNLPQETGEWSFNLGTINYHKNGQELEIVVKLKDKHYRFYEEVPNAADN